MVNESNIHNMLKHKVSEKLKEQGYTTYYECKLNGKRIDVIGKKDNILCLVECIYSQRLTDVMNKLLLLRDKNIRLVIARKKKNKNPKARKIIDKIRSSNIEFWEF